MAGVEGMSFAPNRPPPSANKEKSGFCWDGLAEAGSADFFDQFVELGDSDVESSTEGGGELGHLYGASALSMSPQPPVGQMISADRAARQQGHLLPPGAINSASAPTLGSSIVSRSRLHPHYRGASSTADYSTPATRLDEMSYARSFGEAPGGGSISDSELLKLEGLTMRSPRLVIPQVSASEPASPPSQSTSPRKASRLEAFCSKIRNKAATLQGKTQQHIEPKLEPASEASLSTPIISTAQMEPVRGRPRPQDLHVSKQQLPMSPPLTSNMPGAQRPAASNPAGDAGFVNGFLDEPFIPDNLLGSRFVPPLQLNGGTMPQTPLQTPLIDGMQPWQLLMSSPNTKPLWGPSALSPYFAANDSATNNWWDSSADAMDTDPAPASLPLSYHTAANARNASLNLAIQLQHQHSFKYPAPPGTEDNSFATSGLMIHMPQPRSAPSAVLHNDANHRPTRTDHHRRPKPRALSSGARHHQYGPGMSPRKARTVSGSTNGGGGSASSSPKVSARGSRSVTATSSSSLLSTPGPNPATTRRLHRRSASLQTLNHSPSTPSLTTTPGSRDGPAAVHKRRSWTGLHRTTPSSSSSSSLHHQYHAHTLGAAGVGTSPCKRATTTTTSSYSIPKPKTTTPPNEPSTSGPMGDGFVNYTPQDRALLMTGVAPSGSSKTKARREREAAERQREFRDRLARMVQAAGGDVRKLELGGLGEGLAAEGEGV